MRILTTIILIMIYNVSISQWVQDKSSNKLLATSKADNTKSVMGSNNKLYTVFWSPTQAPTNYELRLQITDSDGYTILNEEGSLISDSIPMSTYTSQWSVEIDESDNVYVGVTGTLNNNGYLFKINSEGENLWGKRGIELGSAFLVKSTTLDNGTFLASWLDGSSSKGKLQKFNSNGEALWQNPIELDEPIAQSFMLDNETIVVLSHQLQGGISSRMFARGFSTDGEEVWDNSVALFETDFSTAYNANYSAFSHNNSVYIGYKLAHNNRFDAYVQKINEDGTLPWGINGLDIDVNQTVYEQEVLIDFNPNNNKLVAFCRTTNSSQGLQGIYMQTVNMETGVRAFGDNAKELYELGDEEGTFVLAEVNFTEGIYAFCTRIENSLNINLVNEDGEFYWNTKYKVIANHDVPKARVQLHTLDNQILATFIEERGTNKNVYAQIFDDETLGLNKSEAFNDLRYNNPFNDFINVSSQSIINEYSLINLEGEIIKNVQLKNRSGIINTQDIKSGIYILRVNNSKNQFRSLKVVKN